MKLSLVIPCYNEADNLKNLIELCGKAFTRDDVEVILVDNGSTDHTQELLAELLPGSPQLRSTKVDVNQGYGFGILSGLKEAKGEYIGWTHADLQADPADAFKALEYIEAGHTNAFLKGSRYGRSMQDVFFTGGMSVFDSLVLGTGLRDINAQPNIFPRSVYESWDNPPHDFALDLYAYYKAKKQGVEIIRFPVYFGKRTAGEAHLNSLRAKLKYSLRTIRYTFDLKKSLHANEPI